jgi:hypothetical protein
MHDSADHYKIDAFGDDELREHLTGLCANWALFHYL